MDAVISESTGIYPSLVYLILSYLPSTDSNLLDIERHLKNSHSFWASFTLEKVHVLRKIINHSRHRERVKITIVEVIRSLIVESRTLLVSTFQSSDSGRNIYYWIRSVCPLDIWKILHCTDSMCVVLQDRDIHRTEYGLDFDCSGCTVYQLESDDEVTCCDDDILKTCSPSVWKMRNFNHVDDVFRHISHEGCRLQDLHGSSVVYRERP